MPANRSDAVNYGHDANFSFEEREDSKIHNIKYMVCQRQIVYHTLNTIDNTIIYRNYTLEGKIFYQQQQQYLLLNYIT